MKILYSFFFIGVIAFAFAKSASNYNYCSANLVGPSVDTEGLKLVLLQGISRHGDRTPASYFPQMENGSPVVWNCTLEQFETPVSYSDSWMYNAPSRLFRRVYLPDVEVLPGNCYFGQLTQTGFNQTRDYGMALRSVYVDKYGFLPPYLDYENHDSVWFRTTDLYRTHQSLESQINGLYPPHVGGGSKVQNIAVHTRDTANEIMWPNTAICPALATATNKVMESAAFQAIETRMAPIKNSLMSLWNMTDNSFPGWSSIFDVVLCRQCHGRTLPLGLTPDMVNAIVVAANEEFTLLNNDPTCGRLGMGQFTAELVNNIENKINGASKVKYIAYSGHDTTVGPLLGNWGVYDGNWPPYTANVQIELWFNPQGSAQQQTQYFVQIKYNGDILQLPGCSTQMCNYYQELKPYLVSRSATAQDCF